LPVDADERIVGIPDLIGDGDPAADSKMKRPANSVVPNNCGRGLRMSGHDGRYDRDGQRR
jgi:hypothetical protein